MNGEVIGGRYRIIEPIGQGGHGAVYRAAQLGLKREVALKLMHPQRMDAGVRERFQREAELAQRLSHPNTIRLLDFGVHEDQTPYIVFELLRGRTLKELIQREAPLSDARSARIATQVLKSLMEAHSVGIIHRDIKPTNIFVGEYAGEPDFAKVMDFGIAKSLRNNTKVLTTKGEVMGTPSYMPPEHIETRPVAPSSDLYSLGLVMAEMVSGQRVFDGTPLDVCVRQASSDPVPLPREVSRSVLRDVIIRATRKNMDERYQSAAEMLRDVEVASGSASLVQSNASWGTAPYAAHVSQALIQTNPSLNATYPPSPSTPMSGPMSFATATPQRSSPGLAVPLALVALALGLAVAIALVFFFRGRPAAEAQNAAPIPVSAARATGPVVIEPEVSGTTPESSASAAPSVSASAAPSSSGAVKLPLLSH